MILSFDRPATRKLELLATQQGIDIDGDQKDYAPEISAMVMTLVETVLDRLKPNTTHPATEAKDVSGA